MEYFDHTVLNSFSAGMLKHINMTGAAQLRVCEVLGKHVILVQGARL